jgi:hypothetical protein
MVTKMSGNLIIHGKVRDQVFVPDEPMPDIEGPAELVVYPVVEPRPSASGTHSVFDFIGKANEPRSAEDIDAQLCEERDAWNDL